MKLVDRGIRKIRRVANQLYSQGVDTARAMARGKPSQFTLTRLSTEEDFLKYTLQTREERTRRLAVEEKLAKNQPSFQTTGFCFVCSRWTRFTSTWEWSYERDGRNQINWREHLLCPHCNLNNRTRAAIHLAEVTGLPLKKSHVYATEEITPLSKQLAERSLSMMGSEYLADTVPLGP
jgi:hypothetical protein